MPAGLLLDRRLSAQARHLYATLQHIAGYGRRDGECTYSQLCARTGASPHTVKRAVRDLVALGWLEVSQRNKFSPVHFALKNPVVTAQQAKVKQIQQRLKKGSRGEALMREYLSLLVDSDEHEDNATPAFLINPFTGQEMQFDRYYPGVAAFEFNGAQHYETTEKYPDAVDLLKQQARDHMKRLICARRGLPLVVVHAEDMTLERMRAKVQGLLPLRDLTGQEAIIAYLEQESADHRQNVPKGIRRSA